MKATRSLAAVLCGALLLCGCTKNGNTISDDEAAPVTVYESTDYIQMITCDNGELYMLSNKTDPEKDGYSALITVYDNGGKITAEQTVPEVKWFDIKCMCASGGSLYLAVDRFDSMELCEWTIPSAELKPIAELDNVTDIRKLAVSDNRLYWLSTNYNKSRFVEPFTCKSGEVLYYNDSGNTLGSADLTSGEISISDIEFPSAFSAAGENVWVYGFDNIGGFYFTELGDPDNKFYTEKLGEIMSFEMLDESRFAFIGSQAFLNTLSLGAADGKSGVVTAAENIDAFFPKTLCADGNFAYVVTTADNNPELKCVKRFDLSDVKPTGKPIKLITTHSDQNTPRTMGMETELTRMSAEEFALTVLALDKTFDCALLSSEDGCAHDVMSKGSFYPLNEVEGVSEYLDKCFPYIKEAALTEDGEIWMLPIEIDVPLLVYNAENCAKAGIEFPTDWRSFIDTVKRAGESSEYCGCLRFRLVQSFFSQYLAARTGFDDPEFREAAELIKNNCSGGVFEDDFDLQQSLLEHQWQNAGLQTAGGKYKKIYENYLFSMITYRRFQIDQGLVENNDLRAAPLPIFTGTSGNAICAFLCVNPFSERLDETLEFISQLSRRLAENNTGFMLADNPLRESGEYAQSLYAVYANSNIAFDLPSEIYWSDFERYCANEISLDSFIAEADRKLAAYVNE